MRVYIKAISFYVPDNVVTNADIIKDFPDWTERKISGKIGISQRFVSKEMTAGDMAENAADKLFAENGLDRSMVDAVMLCTQSPDYFLPTTACILQSKLGLRNDIMAFDYNLGCSGYVYGLGIAKSLVAGGLAKNVLLLTAETYSKYIHVKDRGNRALFSDAASATLVSVEGFAEILNPVYGTDGRGYRNLIVETGCGRNPQKAGIEINPSAGIMSSPDYLYMNGPAIFNFTLDVVPQLVKDVLTVNGLVKNEIGLYVFHQANKYMLEFLRQAVDVPEDIFYLCVDKFGNTVSSTIPIALVCAKNEDRLSGNIMISGFGVGYSWGGTVLKVE